MGFCRLRIPSESLRKEITDDSALIRELHVYGSAVSIGKKGDVQHKGLGKKLVAKAEELAKAIPNSWIPSQFTNDANVDAHRKNTALEIIKDFPEGIDYLITGVGTGGHISGVSEILKKKFPKLKVFAVEPEESPVIEGGSSGSHPLQGIGAGFIPENLNTSLLDGTIQVSKEEAFEFAKKAAKLEGLFVGISSGASLAAVAKKIKELPAGSRILTFSYDVGERYLSVEGLY